MIRLISSLAYASVVKLGYDPTMELLWKHDKWNYQIIVKGKDNHQKVVTKVYKTIDIIADLSNLRGRATRVYEAYDIENPDSVVVIKDSWVDANCSNEGDTLSEILDDASDDEKAMFLTVLVHGVVTIDGREDLTQDLHMNGYLLSTDVDPQNGDDSQVDDDSQDDGNSQDDQDDDDSQDDESDDFEYEINALKEMMAVTGNTGHSVEGAQVDHIYKASIFEILRPSKPASQPSTLVTSPDVSTVKKAKLRPRVYSPKAHYRIVFKERGQSLHDMSRLCQVKLPLVVQAMYDIVKGSMILSVRASESF